MICYKLCILIYLVVVGYSNPIPPSTDKEEVTMAKVTRRLNEEKFCDFPDVAAYKVYKNYKWKKHNLTYRIENYSPKLSKDEVDDTIKRALQVWSDVSPLRFTRIFSGTADIMIGFAVGDHGDGMTFNGSGGDLAHAIAQYEGSVVHFDDDEDFTTSNSRYKFLHVAAHEVGHTLGLNHSTYLGAVMYEQYIDRDTDLFALSQDDIHSIQSIYGPPNPDKKPVPKRINNNNLQSC
ncbi:collagenase 3-like [Misgurnus anguillicaudatus]|uniref:collagenase 3-like n=1 Tax=Misgurnus anguillicaudatus TaxID=75329 RepID=UPI003CCFA465